MKSSLTSIEKVASIDIGTNTILLLIAAVGGERLKPLYEAETVARLGEGVQKSSILSPDAMKRGIQVLAQYLEQCGRMGVRRVFAVGTSALREAKNSAEFLRRVEEKLSLKIEIVSGEEEAYLSFLSVARDLNSKESILVVDVGGGSTEFISGKGDQMTRWVSLPLGSVRLTEKFLASDPVQEEEWETMVKEIRRLLVKIPHPLEPFLMVAVAGTATTLAAVELGLKEFVPEKIHNFVLRQEASEKQLLLYRSKTLHERKQIPGLPTARADVILAGGAILDEAMKELGHPSTLVSIHGVRYGVLYKKIAECGFRNSRNR